MISFPLQFSTLLWTLPLAFVTFCVILFIIVPLQGMSFYKREGVITYFFPLLGAVKLMLEDFDRKSDMFATSRTFSRDNPNQKVLVTNLKHKALVILKDPKHTRDFFQKANLYEKDRSFITLLPLAGTGLIFAEGEVWKRHRKILSNSFNYDFPQVQHPSHPRHYQRVLRLYYIRRLRKLSRHCQDSSYNWRDRRTYLFWQEPEQIYL